jgi:hypothetical protein
MSFPSTYSLIGSAPPKPWAPGSDTTALLRILGKWRSPTMHSPRTVIQYIGTRVCLRHHDKNSHFPQVPYLSSLNSTTMRRMPCRWKIPSDRLNHSGRLQKVCSHRIHLAASYSLHAHTWHTSPSSSRMRRYASICVVCEKVLI